jgi:tetratricopeptide (TPR) repeat protein
MLQPKRKISKKELKQDALVASYVKATAWYEQHRRTVSIGVTAVVVAIVAVVVYVRNRADNNEHAQAQLGQIMQYYDNGQYQLAIDGVPERNIPGLRSIVNNYGNSEGGDLARFYLGGALYGLGKYDEAFEEFDTFSAPNDLLESSRLAGMAACREAVNRFDEAARLYERAAGGQGIAVPENLYHAARTYALAGDKEKALDLYTRIKKNHPTSSYAKEADRQIARLSV